MQETGSTEGFGIDVVFLCFLLPFLVLQDVAHG